MRKALNHLIELKTSQVKFKKNIEIKINKIGLDDN